jgi:hypothetical protein
MAFPGLNPQSELIKMRKSLIIAMLGAALPLFMSDDVNSAAPLPDDVGSDAAPNSGDATEGDATSSAPAVTDDGTTVAAEQSTDTAASADTTSADVGEQAADATDSDTAPAAPSSSAVEIAADSHSEAKDRFTSLMAKLHQFEQDTIEELREDLHAIGVLLHLHSAASDQAEQTGDSQPGDPS